MSSTKRYLRKLRWLARLMIGRDVFVPIRVQVPKERIGSEYGGWCVATDYVTSDSVIYSFGIGTDISFDLGMMAKYGVNVFAFDPTPQSVEWVRCQQIPSGFSLHEFGLAARDGRVAFYPPEDLAHVSHTLLNRPSTASRSVMVEVRRLQTILAWLGHSRVDVLKMDIEGAEYDVIADVLASQIPIGQLCVEFHHGMDGVTAAMTKTAVQALNSNGFLAFDVSETGRECSFIHSDVMASVQ